jgi:hypothetical protein
VRSTAAAASASKRHELKKARHNNNSASANTAATHPTVPDTVECDQDNCFGDNDDDASSVGTGGISKYHNFGLARPAALFQSPPSIPSLK